MADGNDEKPKSKRKTPITWVIALGLMAFLSLWGFLQDRGAVSYDKAHIERVNSKLADQRCADMDEPYRSRCRATLGQ